MPVRFVTACAEPGCPVLTDDTRCFEHKRQHAIETGAVDRKRIYNSRKWRGMRARVLKEQPFCTVPGCQNLTLDVDHILPLEQGGEPYDRDNLAGYCKMHHGEKTRKERYGFKA